MKKISLLMLLFVLAFVLPGCGSSYNPKVENFEEHLYSLADDPEDHVNVVLRYNRTESLDDAFATLDGYITKSWPVSANEAEDAWIYISHYIDALHAEIDELYEEYQDAY